MIVRQEVIQVQLGTTLVSVAIDLQDIFHGLLDVIVAVGKLVKAQQQRHGYQFE